MGTTGAPPTRNRPVPGARAALTRLLILGPVLALAGSACSSEPAAAPTSEEYTAALTAVCVATTERLAAIARPADDATVAPFAVAVADVLRDEAEEVRALGVPDELEADHRAFIRNTDEQAAAWEGLAATTTDDAAFAELTTAIGQLTLGRNDLAADMGVPECARAPA